jgi:MFS family permease
VAAYGCEGLGYIVTGTFLVSIAEKIPGMQGFAAASWAIAGAAAVPSCLFWSWLAKKTGQMQALILSMVLQAAGIAIPVFLYSPFGAITSALLFGATFMGITTLATSAARQMYPSESSRVIGYMTAVYGAGQMIGPTGAGILASFTRNYDGALAGAAVIVLLGAGLLWGGHHKNT